MGVSNSAMAQIDVTGTILNLIQVIDWQLRLSQNWTSLIQYSEFSTVLTNLLTDLVTNSVITSTQGNAIIASGKKMISRAEELGLGLVRIGYITEARA